MANENGEICGPEDADIVVPKIGIGEWLLDSFTHGDQEKIILIDAESGQTVSNREALSLTTGIATSLREKQIQPGDVIALIGESSIDLTVAGYAAAMIGAVTCPIDASYKSYEFQHLFKLIEPRLILCDLEAVSTVKHAAAKINCSAEILVIGSDEDLDDFPRFESLLREIDPDTFEPYKVQDLSETLCLVCTSGTTGLPKAVMITHGGLGFQIASAGYSVPSGPTLQTSYFYWISGVLMMYAFAVKGVPRVLLKSTDPLKVLKTIDEFKVGVLVFSPTLLSAVVHHPDVKSYNLTSVPAINCGGSVLLKATAEKAAEVLPGAVIIQVYGLSEMSGPVCKSLPPLDIYSLGRPNAFTKVKVVDITTGETLGPEQEGELLIKSPGVMKGYYRNEEATKQAITEDGWFRTGDLGVYSEDGILKLTGRVKDLLKFENHQICPAEIELLIGTLPGVDEVVVVGIQEGENSLPMALVIPSPDSKITEEDITAIVDENLSDFKRLRGGVVFVNYIPRTSNGKLRRRDIQPMAEELYKMTKVQG